MPTLLQNLMVTGSVAVLASVIPMSAVAQTAGQADEATVVDEIVVTGTSIRGVAPVGSNLVGVTSEDLKTTGAETITQALQSVPSLTGMGATGQGGTAAHYQPSIRSLGASASNSTLVLIDGHRGPTGGTNHTFLDPNIIPMTMIERVEVLAEGASATYGSDAVAGVVNFITRRRYDGIQIQGSTTIADGSTGYSGGVVAGRTWDDGSAIFGYSYTDQDSLQNADRPWTNPDQRGRGGTNFLSFNCGPASLQPAGQSLIFMNASATTGVANTAANAACTNWDVTDRVGGEIRHNVMAKLSQRFGDDLTLGLDVVYGRRRNASLTGAGTVQATVFETGAQANPFYREPAGYSGPATSQTIRWDATELFGPATSRTGSDSFYTSFTADYAINEDWNFDFLAVVGRDVSDNYSEGTINGSVANLALNGTTNGGGNISSISIPGTNVVVLQLPLTAANALDVWNPAATNRTSAAVRAALLDNDNMLRNTSSFQQVRGVLSGSLFELPAGPLRFAAGAEIYQTQLDQFVARANNSGPASQGSQQLNFEFDRRVNSGFVELNVPVVSSDMGVPLVQQFDLSLSYRYDDYDDFGETKNPRIAFGWVVNDDLTLRANYSTSFVAPPLTILGDQYGAFGTAGWNAVTNNVPVPLEAYPILASMGIPGCTATSVTCDISSLQGLQVTSGDTGTGAQEGDGYSMGFDYNPSFLPGLTAQITYWNTTFEGGVTGPNIQNVVNTGSANFLLNFFPTCATPQQIADATLGIPQRTTAPSCVNYIFRSLNSNWLNLDIQGFDYAVKYVHDTDFGSFRVGVTGTQFTGFEQSFGNGSSYDILDTTGNNGTFPSVGTQIRANLGWSQGPISADLFVNHTGDYRNWSGNSVTPIERDANRNPSGGGDAVDSNTTLDLRFAYAFEDGPLAGAEVSIAGRNVLDSEPPFYNSAQGYDGLLANPFGRRITIGFTMKLF